VSIHLDSYHAAVSDYLLDELPFLASVEEYPEVYDELLTPCGFFGVMDWDKPEDQTMTGQLSLSLNCQLLLVFTAEKAVSHKSIRNAAMAASLKIDNARFGLEVAPALFVSAQPWAFEPGLEQYEVWAVSFKHEVEIGVDEYAAMPDFLPTKVYTGVPPSTGLDAIDEYDQVVLDE
jgi:hypothetical protein